MHSATALRLLEPAIDPSDARRIRIELNSRVSSLAGEKGQKALWGKIYNRFRDRYGIHPMEVMEDLQVHNKLEAIDRLGAIDLLRDCAYEVFGEIREG